MCEEEKCIKNEDDINFDIMYNFVNIIIGVVVIDGARSGFYIGFVTVAVDCTTSFFKVGLDKH